MTVGIRQFLGSSVSMTAVGDMPEVSQTIDPAHHVGYAHADPTSVAQTRKLLAGTERAAVLELMTDSTNLVNLKASSRVRVVPGGPSVIFHLFGDHRPVELSPTRGPSQPRTREELVHLTVGRKTGQS